MQQHSKQNQEMKIKKKQKQKRGEKKEHFKITTVQSFPNVLFDHLNVNTCAEKQQEQNR